MRLHATGSVVGRSSVLSEVKRKFASLFPFAKIYVGDGGRERKSAVKSYVRNS
jgi:hypothetical protein